MKLSQEIKQAIINEYNEFVDEQYGNNDKKKRKELGQFFTPPDLTIKMVEMFECEDLSEKKILDPACGAGGLLVACVLAGAKVSNIFGNEYDEKITEVCRKRVRKLIINIYNENPTDYRISGKSRDFGENTINEDMISEHIHTGDSTKGDWYYTEWEELDKQGNKRANYGRTYRCNALTTFTGDYNRCVKRKKEVDAKISQLKQIDLWGNENE